MKRPTEKTIKRIFALSRNRCAFPGCESQIVEASGSVVGDVCHIRAANRKGPRYDPGQTPEERHAFENLILLCKPHHKRVDDNPATFTVDQLRDIKEMHERHGDIELSQEGARLAGCLYASLVPRVRAGRGAQVMVDSPGGVQIQNVHSGDLVITEKHVSRNVVQAGPEHITDAQAFEIKRMIDKLSELDVVAGHPDSHGGWYTRLYRRYKITSYKLLPAEEFDGAMAYLRQQVAISQPKLRRNDNQTWRANIYGVIWAKARELGLSPAEVHALANARLNLKRPIRSLKELGEQNLERLYRLMRNLR